MTVNYDPHLSQKLAGADARVIFHSMNGVGEGKALALNRAYHEANLTMRARRGRLWIVTVDAADPAGKLAGQAPSGVMNPNGKWAVRAEPEIRRGKNPTAGSVFPPSQFFSDSGSTPIRLAANFRVPLP